MKRTIYLALLLLPTGSRADELLIGRVFGPAPGLYKLGASPTMEHTVESSTVPVRREFWKLRCEAKKGEALAAHHCWLKRIIVDPCPLGRTGAMSFESYEHDSARGSLKVTKFDFEGGILEFDLLEAGGDAVYGKNELSGTLKFNYVDGGIHLLGVSAKGKYKACDTDDYDAVTLAPPKKAYIIHLPARFKESSER